MRGPEDEADAKQRGGVLQPQLGLADEGDLGVQPVGQRLEPAENELEQRPYRQTAKDVARLGAADLARYQHLGAGGALGIRQPAVLAADQEPP